MDKTVQTKQYRQNSTKKTVWTKHGQNSTDKTVRTKQNGQNSTDKTVWTKQSD